MGGYDHGAEVCAFLNLSAVSFQRSGRGGLRAPGTTRPRLEGGALPLLSDQK